CRNLERSRSVPWLRLHPRTLSREPSHTFPSLMSCVTSYRSFQGGALQSVSSRLTIIRLTHLSASLLTVMRAVTSSWRPGPALERPRPSYITNGVSLLHPI